jgi:lysosomal alpha-mannosidase
MGFKNIVLSRIDYKEKEIRKKNKTMEFVWKPFSQIDNSTTEIFTHIQFDGYCMPGKFGNLIDDKEINFTDVQLANVSLEFYYTLKNISATYNHNQVLFTYGCDFSYRNRTFNFKNLERIMDYFSKNAEFEDVRLIYSTPSTYFKVVKEIQSKWPVYENQDFFPYAENPFSYWTGYFSSRPYLKGMVRDAGNFLLSSSNLLAELVVKDSLNKTKR